MGTNRSTRRLTRREFALLGLPLWALAATLWLGSWFFATSAAMFWAAQVMSLVAGGAFVATTIARLRDAGHSPAWAVAHFASPVGCVVMGCLLSRPTANR